MNMKNDYETAKKILDYLALKAAIALKYNTKTFKWRIGIQRLNAEYTRYIVYALRRSPNTIGSMCFESLGVNGTEILASKLTTDPCSMLNDIMTSNRLGDITIGYTSKYATEKTILTKNTSIENIIYEMEHP